MSYSFIVRAADKADALRQVAAELAKVEEAQPIHAVDRAQAEAAAAAFIALLPDDDTKGVQVNVHGSVSWTGTDVSIIIGASVGVSASLMEKSAV